MASDHRIRIVLSEREALICGKCVSLIEGVTGLPKAGALCFADDPTIEDHAVYIGDPNDMENTILCASCYYTEDGEETER